MEKKKAIGILSIIGGAFILSVVIFLVNRSGSRGNSTGDSAEYAADEVSVEQRDMLLDKPSFSAESGFYEEEFSLILSCDKGNQIYYTLDGTDPAGSKSAALYEKPLIIYDNTKDANMLSAEEDITLGEYHSPIYNVDKGMVVRAVLKNSQGKYGETVTKSYFVNKAKSFYATMKVISMVINPYHLMDMNTGIYVVGNRYYEWKNSSEYDENLPDWEVKNPTNYNMSGRDWERPATIQVFDEGILSFEQVVGVRLAGNVSRSNAQKSFRLYAREEYGDKKMRFPFFTGLQDWEGKPIQKFDKVTLRNGGNDTGGTFIRDEVVQALVADRAVSVQAEEPCALFINGEYWGCYHLKERLEDYYFEQHYGIPEKNVSIIKNEEFEGAAEILEQYQDFYDWAMSSDLSISENYEKVWEVLDMQSFMDYFAIETYINNKDWLYDHVNNIMMWRANTPVEGNPYGDGKWRFALFDTEYSSNLYGQQETSPGFDILGNLLQERVWNNPAPLFYQLLENVHFRDTFYDNYLEIVDINFDPAFVSMTIEKYIEKYGEAIESNFHRYWGEGIGAIYLNRNLEGLINFYTERPNYAKDYLSQLYRSKQLIMKE